MTTSPEPMRAEFEAMLPDIRPELHRYVARMVGSAIDAEDVVQEALVKADSSLTVLTPDSNMRGWLFRIAHNKAIDYLRRHREDPLELLDEYPSAVEPDQPLEEKELASFALSLFLKLTPHQRSCVVLKDVMDYSLVEISEWLDATVPEIKAALHRGRTRLRELAQNVGEKSPPLDSHAKALLARYVDRFNARDFDTLRMMLADDVQLDLFGRIKLKGIAEVKERYFHNYKVKDACHLALGTADGQLALLAYESSDSQPDYFMLITWTGKHVLQIRDYRYVQYIMRDVEIARLDG